MTWSSPHDVLRYYVYSADSAEGPWTELEVLKPGVSSHTIPSAYNPTVEKFWRVVASNGVGTVTCQATLGDASAVTWTDLATLGETVASDGTANYRVATSGTGATNALGATTTEAAMYVNGYTAAHTVATKIANTDHIVKFGSGTAKLAGGTDFTTISIGAGTVDLPNATDATFAQTLTGAGTFAKSGAGTLTVANENPDFAGTFEVKEGTLLIGRTDAYKSFGDSAATVKVDSGATLDVGMPGAGGNAVGRPEGVRLGGRVRGSAHRDDGGRPLRDDLHVVEQEASAPVRCDVARPEALEEARSGVREVGRGEGACARVEVGCDRSEAGRTRSVALGDCENRREVRHVLGRGRGERGDERQSRRLAP